jgi:hypothetical protein
MLAMVKRVVSFIESRDGGIAIGANFEVAYLFLVGLVSLRIAADEHAKAQKDEAKALKEEHKSTNAAEKANDPQ